MFDSVRLNRSIPRAGLLRQIRSTSTAPLTSFCSSLLRFIVFLHPRRIFRMVGITFSKKAIDLLLNNFINSSCFIFGNLPRSICFDTSWSARAAEACLRFVKRHVFFISPKNSWLTQLFLESRNFSHNFTFARAADKTSFV